MKPLAVLSLFAASVAAHSVELVNKGSLYTTAENPTSTFHPLQAADDFTVARPVAIKRVEFYGLYGFAGRQRDHFTIRLYADVQGAPARQWFAQFRVGAVKRKRTGQYFQPDVYGRQFEFYAYEAGLPHAVKLPPGRYWLSIVNDVADSEWGVGPIQPGGGHLHFRESDDQSWFGVGLGYGIAFRLYGSILNHTPMSRY